MDRILYIYQQFCWTLGQAFVGLGPIYDGVWPVLGLAPLLLIAMAVGSLDASLQGQRSIRWLRVIMTAQPLLWVVACMIFIPFWDDKAPDRPQLEATIVWIFYALLALHIVTGVAAVVISRGWNRFVTGFFGVVNLWFLFICCLIGAMAISGTWM